MIKITKPEKSNFDELLCSALLSGTFLIKNIDSKVKMMEKIKIQRHPKYVAIKPPANEQMPTPPQDPKDQ